MASAIASQRRTLGRTIVSSPRIMFGLGIFAAMVITAVLAPILAPHDPLEQDLLN